MSGGLSSKPAGLVSHRKALRQGGTVMFVQVAAVPPLLPRALILEHGHCFGIL